MRIERSSLIAIIVGLVISAGAETFLVDYRHRLFWGSENFLFWAAGGLFACLGIVWISKWLGHTFLMRTKDPYTGDHLDTVEENRENE